MNITQANLYARNCRSECVHSQFHLPVRDVRWRHHYRRRRRPMMMFIKVGIIGGFNARHLRLWLIPWMNTLKVMIVLRLVVLIEILSEFRRILFSNLNLPANFAPMNATSIVLTSLIFTTIWLWPKASLLHLNFLFLFFLFFFFLD